ncbi:hypothetical protein J7L02_00355 [Candidatus Woesearchaeota archaeon]|nr:hypothetical protein [Candidatus Woesearchaeota archaeon]
MGVDAHATGYFAPNTLINHSNSFSLSDFNFACVGGDCNVDLIEEIEETNWKNDVKNNCNEDDCDHPCCGLAAEGPQYRPKGDLFCGPNKLWYICDEDYTVDFSSFLAICDGSTRTWGFEETACDDEEDNDFDGLTDCEDPDCEGQIGPNGRLCHAGGEVLHELSCSNGVDEDGDGATDCEDPDCYNNSYCADTSAYSCEGADTEFDPENYNGPGDWLGFGDWNDLFGGWNWDSEANPCCGDDVPRGVPNGDFEEGTNYWEWEDSQLHVEVGGSFAGGHPHTIEVTPTAPMNACGGLGCELTSAFFEIMPGETYTATFEARSESELQCPNFNIKLQFYDENENKIIEVLGDHPGDSYHGMPDGLYTCHDFLWHTYSVTATAPSNARYARVVLVTFLSGSSLSGWYDHVHIFDSNGVEPLQPLTPGQGDYGFISSDNQALCNYVDDSWSWFYAYQNNFKIFNFSEIGVDVASNGAEWFVCNASGRGWLRGEHLGDLEVLPGIPNTPEMQGCLNLSGCCVDVDNDGTPECINFIQANNQPANFGAGDCDYIFNDYSFSSSDICNCIGGSDDTCRRIFPGVNDIESLKACLIDRGVDFYCFGTPSGGAQGGEEQLPLSQCQGLNVVSCLEGLAQFSCSDVNGVVCDEGEVCTGFNFSDANHDNCCLDGLCITPPSNNEECNDSGFNVCAQGQFCDGPYYNMTEGGYCCFGQCVEIPNIVPESNKIICFKNDGKDAFAECCPSTGSVDETCHNYNPGNLDRLVFPQGTSFYSLKSWDYVQDGTLVSGLLKISTDNEDEYVVITTPHEISHFNSIAFSFAAADEDLSNFKVSLGLKSGDSVDWYSLSSTLADFSTTGLASDRWHRIIIPLTSSSFNGLPESGVLNHFKIVYIGPHNGFTALIDNLELIPNTPSDFVSYERFCTGRNWVSDYDNSSFGKFACDAVAGFGWTGHYCCGDDTTVNAGEKEFFNDSLAGCWGGVFVPENVLVGYALNDASLNDVLFFDNQFWVCDPESSKSNVYPYNVNVWFDNDNSGGRLIPNGVGSNNFVPAFTVKGRWFCSFDGVWKPLTDFPGYRALVAYMLNLSLSNSGDNFTLYCDDEGFALNELPEGFEGLFNSSVCVASFKNNNKHRLVIGGVVGNVSKFIEAVNSYFEGVGVPLDACSDAPKLFQPDSFFYVCDASGDSDTNVSLLFNRYTGVVVLNYYANQGVQGFLSGFRAFVKKAWDDLVSYVSDLFGSGSYSHPTVGIPVSDARFDKVFIAKHPGKVARVVLENVDGSYVLLGEFVGFPREDVEALANIMGSSFVEWQDIAGFYHYYINRSSSEPFDDFWNFATGSLRIS